MAKKAVLIGINYPGTSVELRGCVNDVHRMQRCLIDNYGFSNEDITILIDTDKSYIQPTGKNIRYALKKLIETGKSGDFLVFHYSGHGTRLPPENLDDATGFDECITPCDMYLIRDHEFREIVAQVKEGCRLTIISDSCHSGGLVEGVKEQIGESQMKPSKIGFPQSMLSIVMNLILPTCGRPSSQRGHKSGREDITREVEILENGETVEIKSRYLPLDSFISLLEKQTGETGIEIGNIKQILVKVFSEDSSSNVHSNGYRGLNDTFQSKREVNEGGSGSLRSIPDKGILLSGCQTDQKSEDVYVIKTGKAYGAFSDAIQKILTSTRKEKKITNKDMVLRAREILKKQSFSQKPGLYCHDRYLNEPFIC